MFTFDLQAFTEESAAQAAEIPAELEGLTPEIAQEIMAEAEAEAPEEAQQETAEEKPDETQQEAGNESFEAQKAEADSGVKGDTKPENEEEKKPQHIPYERFRQVNEEKKARDEENARLRAQLEALQKQQQEKLAPAAPQIALPPQDDAERQRKLAEYVTAQARKAAMQLHGLTEADMAALEYEQPEKKRAFEASYQLELVKAERQVEDHLRRQQETYQAHQIQRAQANTEYNALVKKFEADEDFGPVFEFASNEYFAALSPLEQRVLSESFERTEKQCASLQDVLIVRDHFLRAQQEYRAKQQAAAQVQTVQQSAEDKVKEKINKAKAHPRTDQLAGGDNDPDGISLAEIERMLDDPRVTIDQIPQAYRKLLLR